MVINGRIWLAELKGSNEQRAPARLYGRLSRPLRSACSGDACCEQHRRHSDTTSSRLPRHRRGLDLIISLLDGGGGGGSGSVCMATTCRRPCCPLLASSFVRLLVRSFIRFYRPTRLRFYFCLLNSRTNKSTYISIHRHKCRHSPRGR